MNRFFRYGLHCSWYCWGLLILALLNFEPVGNLLSSKFGENLFLYTLYMSPVILMWLSMFLHGLGLSSSISIILMISYLVYHGSFITIEAWEFFKPIFQTCDVFYIWDAIIIQSVNSMVYLLSGIFCLTSAVGGVIYLFKNKDSFTFSIDTRKIRKKSQHQNPFGSATLATRKDIEKFATKKKGLAVGLMLKTSIATTDLALSIKRLSKQSSGALIRLPADHTVVIAPTRSGKGVGIIIPNILEHDGGVFVLDPKAELVCITKRHRESQGKKVYVFDPNDRSKLANCKINILDFLPDDKEQKSTAIQELSKLVCPQSSSDNSSSRHFSDSARNCIEWALLFLCFSKCPDNERNLGKIYEILTMSPDAFFKTVKRCSKSKEAGGALARSANIILTTAREEFSGVINTARNYLDFIRSPVNLNATGSSSIAKKDLCDDNVDLFLCVELSDDGTPDKLTQLITRFVFRTIREDRNETSKKDRLMVLDELPALGYLGFVSQALVLGAGYGMKILAVFQSIEKLQTTYPNDWKTFLESSLAVFMNCKGDAAEYVSNRIDKTTINVESESSGQSQQSRQGQLSQNTSQQSGSTQSLTQRNLLTKSEISSFGSDIVIAFYDNCPPMLCRRLNYLENAQFKGKFDDNPLHQN